MLSGPNKDLCLYLAPLVVVSFEVDNGSELRVSNKSLGGEGRKRASSTVDFHGADKEGTNTTRRDERIEYRTGGQHESRTGGADDV